jgi:WD40 repeat protein
LFETLTGKMIARIAALSNVTLNLAFSPDGRYLAAGLGGRNGLRIYDRDRQWSEVFRDTNYGADIYGVDFAADGRLATTSLDGQVRLYDRDFKQIVAPRNPTGRALPFPASAIITLNNPKMIRGCSLREIPEAHIESSSTSELQSVRIDGVMI